MLNFGSNKIHKMSSKKGKVQEAIDQKLLEERKVFLWGMVEDDSAKHVIDRLLYLDMQSNEEIQLFINSPGGYVTSGFAMYDTIKSLKSPVSTICTGLAASMGSILLSVGKKGRRFIQPHAQVMIHQPSGGARGQASNIEIQAKEITRIRAILDGILAKHSGKAIEQVNQDTERDHYMTGQEAKSYGLIDSVISNREEVKKDDKDKK